MKEIQVKQLDVVIYGFLIQLPLLGLKLFFFLSLYPVNIILKSDGAINFFQEYKPTEILLLIFIVLFIGTILHEIIHYLFLLGEKRDVFFGFSKKLFIPYTSFKGQISVGQFIIAAISPYVILGLIPFLASCYSGNLAVFFFSIAFTGAAAGDFIIIAKIINFWNGTLTSSPEAKITLSK